MYKRPFHRDYKTIKSYSDSATYDFLVMILNIVIKLSARSVMVSLMLLLRQLQLIYYTTIIVHIHTHHKTHTHTPQFRRTHQRQQTFTIHELHSGD